MSEEPNKLSFDNKDFKFTTAYNAYVKLFDETESQEDRQTLNDTIKQLNDKEIDFPEFYQKIQPSEDGRARQFHRSQIKGTRKFAYRANERKVDRIKRHK